MWQTSKSFLFVSEIVFLCRCDHLTVLCLFRNITGPKPGAMFWLAVHWCVKQRELGGGGGSEQTPAVSCPSRHLQQEEEMLVLSLILWAAAADSTATLLFSDFCPVAWNHQIQRETHLYIYQCLSDSWSDIWSLFSFWPEKIQQSDFVCLIDFLSHDHNTNICKL